MSLKRATRSDRGPTPLRPSIILIRNQADCVLVESSSIKSYISLPLKSRWPLKGFTLFHINAAETKGFLFFSSHGAQEQKKKKKAIQLNNCQYVQINPHLKATFQIGVELMERCKACLVLMRREDRRAFYNCVRRTCRLASYN